MSDISKTSEVTFQSDVLNSNLPVLVEFGAVWCMPCKQLDPIVRQLAEQWIGKAQVVKVDVDDSPNLAIQYQVMGVPTLMLFVRGKPVERITGYQPKDRIMAKFASYIPS